MGSSDNVLRGGLTSKHVDVSELLATLCFESGPVDRLRPSPRDPVEARYENAELSLSVLRPVRDRPWRSGNEGGPEILLCTEGEAALRGEQGDRLELRRGGSVFVPGSAGAYTVEGEATLYRARVPA